MARLIGLLVCFAACGNITRKQDDAGVVVRDDMNMMTDAGVDAAMAAPTPSRELVPGGGRMTGGGFTFDVQVGHPIQQTKATGGGQTMQGNAAVKP